MNRLLGAALLLVIPASAAADEARLKAAVDGLERLARQAVKDGGVPGVAVAVVHHDRAVYLRGFGVREAGKAGAVDADTVFQLASVSKPLATTVLAALVGEGVVGWDDRVIDHLPTFRLRDPWVTRQVTLRDLLCHRAGLPDHAGDLLEDLGYSRDEVLRRLRYLDLGNRFRSHYAYTNFGFTAAAVAAARTSGKSWEDLAEQKLYRPLGMKSASSRFKDYAAAANRARLHVRADGKWVARHVRQPDAQSPAGGASGSARDLAPWMLLHLNAGKVGGKQLIAAGALAETHRPQMISGFDARAGRASLYGLGWNVSRDPRGKRLVSHSGAFSLGARSTVYLLPDERVGVAVLANAFPSGLPEGLALSFLDLLYEGKPRHDWVAVMNRYFDEEMKKLSPALGDYSGPRAKQLPPLPAAAYAGVYTNAYFGDLKIEEKGGALVGRLGPAGLAFPLRHWDRDAFLYQPTGENAGGRSAVTFRVGADLKAAAVVVEHLDGDGMGTFTRKRGSGPGGS